MMYNIYTSSGRKVAMVKVNPAAAEVGFKNKGERKKSASLVDSLFAAIFQEVAGIEREKRMSNVVRNGGKRGGFNSAEKSEKLMGKLPDLENANCVSGHFNETFLLKVEKPFNSEIKLPVLPDKISAAVKDRLLNGRMFLRDSGDAVNKFTIKIKYRKSDDLFSFLTSQKSLTSRKTVDEGKNAGSVNGNRLYIPAPFLPFSDYCSRKNEKFSAASRGRSRISPSADGKVEKVCSESRGAGFKKKGSVYFVKSRHGWYAKVDIEGNHKMLHRFRSVPDGVLKERIAGACKDKAFDSEETKGLNEAVVNAEKTCACVVSREGDVLALRRRDFNPLTEVHTRTGERSLHVKSKRTERRDRGALKSWPVKKASEEPLEKVSSAEIKAKFYKSDESVIKEVFEEISDLSVADSGRALGISGNETVADNSYPDLLKISAGNLSEKNVSGRVKSEIPGKEFSGSVSSGRPDLKSEKGNSNSVRRHRVLNMQDKLKEKVSAVESRNYALRQEGKVKKSFQKNGEAELLIESFQKPSGDISISGRRNLHHSPSFHFVPLREGVSLRKGFSNRFGSFSQSSESQQRSAGSAGTYTLAATFEDMRVRASMVRRFLNVSIELPQSVFNVIGLSDEIREILGSSGLSGLKIKIKSRGREVYSETFYKDHDEESSSLEIRV